MGQLTMFTRSPGFLNHFASLPLVIVCDSLGKGTTSGCSWSCKCPLVLASCCWDSPRALLHARCCCPDGAWHDEQLALVLLVRKAGSRVGASSCWGRVQAGPPRNASCQASCTLWRSILQGCRHYAQELACGMGLFNGVQEDWGGHGCDMLLAPCGVMHDGADEDVLVQSKLGHRHQSPSNSCAYVCGLQHAPL